MKVARYNLDDNYYDEKYIDSIKIYIDYINRRIKIIDLDNISSDNLKRIISFSKSQKLDKVICNCNSQALEIFKEAGFELEGKINGYFKGEDAFCMSYFIGEYRKSISNLPQKDLLVKKCLGLKNTFKHRINKFAYNIRNANENDTKAMVKLFSTVFSSYPSPIYDEKYLKKTMNSKVLYKVAVYDDKIVGIASADMDKKNLNAEITDCATYSNYRGKGILSNLINSLEVDLKNKKIITLYSLARAINPGINIVLSKNNYEYEGRLINHCSICGQFEDMNIWVKNIKV